MSATTAAAGSGRPPLAPDWSRVFGVRLLFHPATRHRLLRATFFMAAALYLIHSAQQLIGLPYSDLRWDWGQFYNAAQALRHGADPYTAYLSTCPAYHWCVGGYIYPPLFAQLLEPFARLPLLPSAYLWLLCDHLFLLATGIVMYRALRPHLDRDVLLALGIGALMFTPLYQTLFFLQITPLLMLLLAVAAAGFMSGSKPGLLVAGAAIAASTVLRITPVVMLPALVYVRPATGAATGWLRRVELRGLLAAGGAGALLLAGMVLTSRFALSYFTQVLPRIGGGTATLDNVSLPGLVDRAAIMTGLPVPPASLLELIAVAIGVSITWWASREAARDAMGRAAVFGAFLAAMPIVSSITWHHHLTTELLALALLLLAIAGRWSSPGMRRAAMLLTFGMVLMWFDRYQLDPLTVALGLKDPTGFGIPALLVIQSVPIAGEVLFWLASLSVLKRTAGAEAAP